jgi:hypothetical protein
MLGSSLEQEMNQSLSQKSLLIQTGMDGEPNIKSVLFNAASPSDHNNS